MRKPRSAVILFALLVLSLTLAVPAEDALETTYDESETQPDAANANNDSRIPREQLAEAAQVKRSVREYLAELEQENGDGEPVHQQDKVSTTDPDATYASKGKRWRGWAITTTIWSITPAA
jgi:hypothetical protein